MFKDGPRTERVKEIKIYIFTLCVFFKNKMCDIIIIIII